MGTDPGRCVHTDGGMCGCPLGEFGLGSRGRLESAVVAARWHHRLACPPVAGKEKRIRWKPAARRVASLLPAVPGVQAAITRLARSGVLPPSAWIHIPPTGVHELEPAPGVRFRYRACVEDQLARSIVWTDFRHWEYATILAFVRLARMSRGFVDVGAYTGAYSLVAAAANPDIEIVAIEPNARIFPLLQGNLRLNGIRCQSRMEGLGARPGSARLVVPDDATTAHLTGDGAQSAGQPVIVETLDQVANSMATVDLVKIDVEGSELDVLEGGRETLRSHCPRMIIEALTAERASDLMRFLRPLGYRTYVSMLPSGPAPLNDPERHDTRHPNLLCAVDDTDALILQIEQPLSP